MRTLSMLFPPFLSCFSPLIYFCFQEIVWLHVFVLVFERSLIFVELYFYNYCNVPVIG